MLKKRAKKSFGQKSSKEKAYTGERVPATQQVDSRKVCLGSYSAACALLKGFMLKLRNERPSLLQAEAGRKRHCPPWRNTLDCSQGGLRETFTKIWSP